MVKFMKLFLIMKIFTEKPLVDFIESNPKYRIALQDWRTKVKESEWECFDDITKDFENIEQIDKILQYIPKTGRNSSPE